MPYYQWVGIDILGNTRKGLTLAASPELLEQDLFVQEIALLKTHTVQKKYKAWNHHHTINFFKQLTVLLGSGVFLTDALNMLVELADNQSHKDMLSHICTDVHDGSSLSSALTRFDDVFDKFTVTLIKAGEEGGKLGEALEAICKNLETREQFYSKMRSAAMVPAVTLSFFIIIFLVIMTCIVPRFEQLFEGRTDAIPSITRWFLWMSKNISWIYSGLLGGMGVGYFIYKHKKWWRQIKPSLDQFLVRIPILNKIIINSSLVSFLRPLSVLLEGRISLLQALEICCPTINNIVVKATITAAIERVRQGFPLSEALKKDTLIIPPSLLHLISIGEESGRLELMIKRCSEYYEESVIKVLDLVAVLFQPFIMIIIGVLVALLIFAVYMPICELANNVSYV